MIDMPLDIPLMDLVVGELGGVAYRMLHKRPAWDGVNQLQARHSEQLWASRGASGEHGPWEAAAASTQRRRGRKGLMRQEDDLYRSLSQPYDAHRIFQATDERIVALGTNVPYARHHQEGGGRLPQRYVIDHTREQEDAYARLTEHFILTGEVRIK